MMCVGDFAINHPTYKKFIEKINVYILHTNGQLENNTMYYIYLFNLL